MTRDNIKPEKITKPIQLLGAWLAGLFSVNSTFLVAAVNLTNHDWLATFLVIAAILNVPVFLIAVFVLQTKFRPELQEDAYYAEYISQKTNEKIKVSASRQSAHSLLLQVEKLETKLATIEASNKDGTPGILSGLLFGINLHFKDEDRIKSLLLEQGVSKVTRFGDPDNEPTRRVVSISQYLSNDKVIQISELASRLGMDGYALFDNLMEETAEDVLIGSYGSIEYELIPS